MPKDTNPRSGLRTVVRDFSSSQELSQASQSIPWPASPIQPQPAKPMSSREARMRAIEEGIRAAGRQESSSKAALAALTSLNKRPPSDAVTRPFKKSRTLPNSFQDAAYMVGLSLQDQQSSISRTSSSSINDLSAFQATPNKVVYSTTKTNIPDNFLSAEQKGIIELAKKGVSLFYTGSAGTGKSLVLRRIIETLKEHHKDINRDNPKVAITASTGIAACNIGGTTIHSFAGLGLGEGSVEQMVTRVKKNRKVTRRWQTTKVLIIDEISMVDADLFDKLSGIACAIRKSTLPFGGIQLIVTGDFFQLPPVSKSGSVKFAFEADSWKESITKTINLTKVFRQNDQTFVDMLNEMRLGVLSQPSIQRFQRLSRPIHYDDGVAATELYPRRENVDNANIERLRKLSSISYRFPSVDGGKLQDVQQRQKMLANFMAPQFLELRVDAQVMLIKNSDDLLVNGSLGRIVRFVDPAVYGTVYDKEATLGEVGVIGSVAAISGVGAAARKQGYTSGSATNYPVVEFVSAQTANRRMLVLPETWNVESDGGEIQVSRTQLPLILAWAMSIHKSQGQTLDRVKVDLGKIFEKGQAYVALSRATSLDGLQVLNFSPAKVMAHPKVIEWSKSLTTLGGK